MSDFWDKFEDLMDSASDLMQSAFKDSSIWTSEIQQGGKKIIVKTVGKKTTITVNGKKVYSE